MWSQMLLLCSLMVGIPRKALWSKLYDFKVKISKMTDFRILEFQWSNFWVNFMIFFLMTHLWNLYIRYEHELNYHQHKTEFKNINQELRYKTGQSYMTWHITLTTIFFCFFDSSQALMYVHHNVKEFFKNSHRKVLFLLRSMLYAK